MASRGLAAGALLLAACASSDPVLENERQFEALRAARGPCEGEGYESCYGGPQGTEAHGACRAGQRQCEGSLWGPCIGEATPTRERCNRVDDDCDGVVDNGFERDGALCFASNTQGVCRSQGTWHCSKDGRSSLCDAPTIAPTAEICDGKDNDCDGQIDDDAIPEGERTCSTGRAGVCSAGERRCVNATVRCVQSTQASSEICNRLDDDCDGEVDEHCANPGGEP